MSQRGRLLLGVVTVALALLVAIGGAYALSLWQIRRSQELWCPTLELIAKHPPQPGQPASSVQVYHRLVRLRWEIGCRQEKGRPPWHLYSPAPENLGRPARSA